MTRKEPRILIFGAGVIGSVYAIKFAQAKMDVTMLARGARLETLRKKELQYDDKGVIRSVKVRVIDRLDEDDIYDYILVPVRYDQIEGALAALQQNQSPNIVTMTTTSVGYDGWLPIVGARLIPGFPNAGGDIRDGVLYAKIAPSFIHKTIFGEISSQMTPRVLTLAKVFKTAGLPTTISANILAFHITKAVLDTAMFKVFLTDGGIMTPAEARKKETLRAMAQTLKRYLHLVEKRGIPITPSTLKFIMKCPDWLIVLLFSGLLRSKKVAGALLGNHTVTIAKEIQKLDEDFLASR